MTWPTRLLLVGVFGAAGAMCRYAIGLGALRLLPTAPGLGTFVVNVVGCYFFGLVTELALGGLITAELRLFLLTGFIGAFTTFSTYSYDAIVLAETRGVVLAVLGVVGQNALAVGAVLAGMGTPGLISSR